MQLDSNQTVSEKPGAIQLWLDRCRYAACVIMNNGDI